MILLESKTFGFSLVLGNKPINRVLHFSIHFQMVHSPFIELSMTDKIETFNLIKHLIAILTK